MAVGLRVDVDHALDHISLPQQEFPVFRPRQNLPVRELVIREHVGNLQLPELRDLALELQPREGLGHLPELYVAHARGREDVLVVVRERDPVNLLAEGLRLEQHDLLLPIPDADLIVGVGAHARDSVAFAAEANVRVGSLCAFSQDSVESPRGGFVDVNIWVGAFFGDCVVFFCWVHLRVNEGKLRRLSRFRRRLGKKILRLLLLCSCIFSK